MKDGSPARERSEVARLSAECSAFELRESGAPAWNRTTSSAVSGRRSLIKLQARTPAGIRTREMPVCKTGAFVHLATGANWCAE